ncbi:MAG: RodZ domain-containing protein [Alphaproteobacteria bacterium]
MGFSLDYWDRQGTASSDIHVAVDDWTDAPVRFDYDPNEWQAYPLAAILKAYREAYGLDLPEVSEHLRIRPHYLGMLEDGRYDELPARPYAIGFVRSYAKYLGLPVEDMVARFREEIDDLQAPPVPQKLAMAHTSARNDSTVSRFVFALLAVVGLMSSWTLWTVVASDDRNVATANLGNENAVVADTFLYGVTASDPTAKRVLEIEGRELPVQPVLRDVPEGQEVVVIQSGTEGDLDPRYQAPVAENVFGVPIPKVREVAVAPSREDDPEIDTTVRYRLVAVDLVWVQVRDYQDNIIASRMLQRDDELSVTHQDGLRLFTVAPRNLEIFVGDEMAEPEVPDRNQPVVWPLNREYLLPFSNPDAEAVALY